VSEARHPANWLTVMNLIKVLERLPPDLPVMLPAESNVDFAYAAHVKMVVRDAHNWSGTPVGRFLLVDKLPVRDEQASAKPTGWDAYAPRPSGESFQAVVLDLHPSSEIPTSDQNPGIRVVRGEGADESED
jgi:hypothetical protein